MSSQDKDSLEKQDTSKSSDSQSNNEVNEGDKVVSKAEEELKHLELQEHLTKEKQKDDSIESKQFDSTIQGTDVTSKYLPMTEPVVGPSRLKEFHLPISDVKSDPGPKGVDISSLQKERSVETKTSAEDVKTKYVKGDSDTTEKTPSFIQSSPETSSENLLPPRIPYRRYLNSDLQSDSSSERANTLSDVSEIVSEIASECGDARESFQRDQSPSYVPDLRRQCSETSDANISEIQDDYLPPLPTPNSSVSTSSGEYGNRRTEELFQREADEREFQSLGILSSKHSKSASMSQLGLVGNGGKKHRDIPDLQKEDRRPASEPLEALLLQRELEFKRLPQDEKEGEEKKISNILEDVKTESAAICIQKVEERTVSNVGGSSPSNRRQPSKFETGSSSGNKDQFGRLSQINKPHVEERGKLVSGKLNDPSQSDSELTELKSTSSDGSPLGVSMEIGGLSESFKPQLDKKHWQKPGILQSMQHSTMSSIDSIITEEADLPKDPSPELMETGEKAKSPVKMETSHDTGVEIAAATNTGISILKPPVFESSQLDQSNVSGAEGVYEQGPSFQVEEIERKAGKCKRRDANLSRSPLSDRMPGSSPKNLEIDRPSKRVRSEEELQEMPESKHDSNDESESDSSSYLFQKNPPKDPSTRDSSKEKETGF